MTRQTDTSTQLIIQAQDYARLGWCVIPIPHGEKKARIKWLRYQQQRPDERQLRKWFASNHRNIAVVLGKISGGLVCRDFDVMSAYNCWAISHPHLAATLPTVWTPRGRHVYFESHLGKTQNLCDGEIRRSGCYCLLPPSIHPDGPAYYWLIHPTAENLIHLDNLEGAGFLSPSHATESTERTEEHRGGQRRLGGEGDSFLEGAILRTLPKEHGTRHKMVFEFARELKSAPQYSQADPILLRPVVQEWHRRALPYIKTKDFEETWIDFLQAWPKIKFKKGEGPMAQIFSRAFQVEPPKVALDKYPTNPQLQLLAALCRELQTAAGDGPFFLGTRTAGRLLGVDHWKAWRWLFLLQTEGVIREVTKGGTAENPRKASRYRYIGG